MMFRKMRRSRQQLTEEECIQILYRNKSGVLAVSGDDGYPYAVPLSYVYLDGKIYFHCALTGHKTDAIARNDKVSFCVTDKDEIVPERFTTYYASVIVFGRAAPVGEREEKQRILFLLAQKYSPGICADHEIAESKNTVALIGLSIEHMTGKQAKELIGQKEQ